MHELGRSYRQPSGKHRNRWLGESATEGLVPGKTSRFASRLRESDGPFRQGAKEKSTPDTVRTCNLRFRRPMLYPIELRVHKCLARCDLGHRRGENSSHESIPTAPAAPAGRFSKLD
jgi:hypothetical protein